MARVLAGHFGASLGAVASPAGAREQWPPHVASPCGAAYGHWGLVTPRFVEAGRPVQHPAPVAQAYEAFLPSAPLGAVTGAERQCMPALARGIPGF